MEQGPVLPSLPEVDGHAEKLSFLAALVSSYSSSSSLTFKLNGGDRTERKFRITYLGR